MLLTILGSTRGRNSSVQRFLYLAVVSLLGSVAALVIFDRSSSRMAVYAQIALPATTMALVVICFRGISLCIRGIRLCVYDIFIAPPHVVPTTVAFTTSGDEYKQPSALMLLHTRMGTWLTRISSLDGGLRNWNWKSTFNHISQICRITRTDPRSQPRSIVVGAFVACLLAAYYLMSKYSTRSPSLGLHLNPFHGAISCVLLATFAWLHWLLSSLKIRFSLGALVGSYLVDLVSGGGAKPARQNVLLIMQSTLFFCFGAIILRNLGRALINASRKNIMGLSAAEEDTLPQAHTIRSAKDRSARERAVSTAIPPQEQAIKSPRSVMERSATEEAVSGASVNHQLASPSEIQLATTAQPLPKRKVADSTGPLTQLQDAVLPCNADQSAPSMVAELVKSALSPWEEIQKFRPWEEVQKILSFNPRNNEGDETHPSNTRGAKGTQNTTREIKKYLF